MAQQKTAAARPSRTSAGNAAKATATTKARSKAQDKDAPLKEDIRLLGRLLGEVIRHQEGETVYEIVETIRQTAVKFRRDTDPQAGADLDRLLKKLTRDQTNAVVRAFSYFSHLANIAEDEHHIRRRRAHDLAGSPPREGSLALSLLRALASGIDAGKLRDFFAGAQVRPVLTAHPTEVRRKSIIDHRNRVAALMKLPRPEITGYLTVSRWEKTGAIPGPALAHMDILDTGWRPKWWKGSK